MIFCDIVGKNYGIYWAKIMGYIMVYWLKIVGYICQNPGIYSSIGYNKLKLRNGLGEYGIYRGKIMGYTKGYIFQKLGDIFVKSYGIYLPKTKGYIG